MKACPTRLTSGTPPARSIVCGHRPARADVVDDLLARRLGEDGLGDERRHEVAGNELPRVVDEEAAVGVPVVGDPEVGRLLGDLRHDELAVLRKERVGLVVREAAVGLEVAADDVELRNSIEDRRQHHAGHPVRRVDHDTQWADRLDVDEREDLGDEARPDILAPDRPSARRGLEARLCACPDLGKSRVSTDRKRSAPDDLHPRVLLGVVRCGDADPAVETELGDRVVQHLRADEPELDRIATGVGDPVGHGSQDRLRMTVACRVRRRPLAARNAPCTRAPRGRRPSSSSSDG